MEPQLSLIPDVLPSGVLRVIVGEDEQQQWSSGVDQEDPEPPHIKEEQEELWSSQEGEQLQGLEEADVTRFSLTPVPVKREDDEEKPHQSPSEENTETQPPTEDAGDHCGGSEAASNGDDPLTPTHHGTSTSDPETDDSEDWTAAGTESPRCSVCLRRFRGSSQLRLHTCVDATSQQRPLTFANKCLLVTHIGTHGGKTPFTCSVCGHEWQCRSHLKIHMRTHTGEKPFSCSLCGKRFTQRRIMTQHMATHSDVKPFSCGVCGKRFFWRFQIKNHSCVGRVSPVRRDEDTRQTGPNVFSCSFCSRAFATGGRLSRHISVHTGEKLLSCVVCDQTFAVESQLVAHRCFHESPENAVAAQKAKSRSRGRKESERKHDPETHTAPGCSLRSERGGHVIRSFCCSVCESEFSDSESLVKHMRIHTEQTQFYCLICDKDFAWRRNLLRHMEVHAHTADYSCGACDATFTWRYQLRYHRCDGETPPADPGTTSNLSCDDEASASDGGEPPSDARTGSDGARQEPVSVSDRKPESDDSVDSDFWKENRRRQAACDAVTEEQDAGTALYGCSHCGRRFLKNCHLWNHMRTHTAEKP